MNDRNTVSRGLTGRAESDLITVEHELSFVRLFNSGKNPHHRGLACAILSDQHIDLISVRTEIRCIKRDRSRIALCDRTCFKDDAWRGHTRCTRLTAVRTPAAPYFQSS